MNDLINGIFELFSGFFLFSNCWILYKDKEVKGINLYAMGFFTLWGYWNLYYYPSLDQWKSLLGGIVIVTANTIWIFLAVHYTRQNRGTISSFKPPKVFHKKIAENGNLKVRK